jgi:hypothetical protein
VDGLHQGWKSSGYNPATTTVTITGGGGMGATADAVIDHGNFVLGQTPGVVTSIIVDNGGAAFETPPTVK